MEYKGVAYAYRTPEYYLSYIQIAFRVCLIMEVSFPTGYVDLAASGPGQILT